ncbi:P-loop containing nucleoside triphosphate hydrolase [Podospora aff. communis PSN243]|uniref:P-loop containing nucleoside triphosphate hydrolase n=1 Tax=Podospora aff. communis PSN243 TaxID=3040156 RepID=A0AAV9GQF0_9PEZI|nr:P-loop containing nucleoside triphosphate hydrolase [Podospora aff. communis PSN243]
MDVLDQLQLPLSRTSEDPRPVVVMTCGIAGSGKSTLAKAIVERHPSFVRLSGDNILHAKHGLYGKDYPPEMYGKYLDEAAAEVEATLVELLEAGERDAVLDRSLYSREDRDDFKRLIERKGARWILVFFRPASRDVIWKRLQHRRRAGIDADSAYDITPEILDGYWKGFENPKGEGEVVVDVSDGLGC